MTKLIHLNCGKLQREGGPEISCHCLLLVDDGKLILIDTGIGKKDVIDPEGRIGKEAINAFGFQFHMHLTAYQQVIALGFDPQSVEHCIISHLDADHIGGLADFPGATVHVSKTEWNGLMSGEPRYNQRLVDHHPNLKLYESFDENWNGFAAAKVEVGTVAAIKLIALPGHTLGHCGVAVETESESIFYTGDAYYLRDELFISDHPAIPVSQQSAMDSEAQRMTATSIRDLMMREHSSLRIFGYHDPGEF